MERPSLGIATWNIHKGFSQFNRRLVVHELRDSLRELGADIVFLQEVQGLHQRHGLRHADWPEAPQHEFLADEVWAASAYGRNVIYDHGHHGNAILSRHPILASHNQDVTHLRFERRGLLHCSIAVPGLEQALHCVCVHLSLFARSRRWQMNALADQLETLIPPAAPLIVAGDFNDWGNRAGDQLARRLNLREAFGGHNGRPARSFPAALPLLRLDRIYVRGLAVEQCEAHHGTHWATLSDHAPLTAQLTAP
ncbi:MAG TPA: endonuclease/exonuclease/phosphatase family protein [Rhodocyclaceae bacterium]